MFSELNKAASEVSRGHYIICRHSEFQELRGLFVPENVIKAPQFVQLTVLEIRLGLKPTFCEDTLTNHDFSLNSCVIKGTACTFSLERLIRMFTRGQEKQSMEPTKACIPEGRVVFLAVFWVGVEQEGRLFCDELGIFPRQGYDWIPHLQGPSVHHLLHVYLLESQNKNKITVCSLFSAKKFVLVRSLDVQTQIPGSCGHLPVPEWDFSTDRLFERFCICDPSDTTAVRSSGFLCQWILPAFEQWKHPGNLKLKESSCTPIVIALWALVTFLAHCWAFHWARFFPIIPEDTLWRAGNFWLTWS